MIEQDKLLRQVAAHPYPLVFATISGAHLYGFPSPDSDFDLRGMHVLPLREVLGLRIQHETVESEGVREGLEIDLVTHDARKFMGLMLKKNGYVLEQLLSPLVVHSTAAHAELRVLAGGCITRHHAHHYLGFAETQWRLFEKSDPPHVKPLLYVYRVLLTGAHLMRTGEVEANLARLNEAARLPFLSDLIAYKMQSGEKCQLSEADRAFHRSEYERLRADLHEASGRSPLPERPRAEAALNDLLIRLRLNGTAPSEIT
ncbi:MAG: nucleotidyltransferase domain-containing protein [Pirellulaceae bacterium]